MRRRFDSISCRSWEAPTRFRETVGKIGSRSFSATLSLSIEKPLCSPDREGLEEGADLGRPRVGERSLTKRESTSDVHRVSGEKAML